MSGGHFNYDQYRITGIADDIERILERQGKPRPKEELYYDDGEWYKKHPEELLYYTYPVEVQEELKTAVKILRQAAIYAHRVDYLLSGDDDEENFLERLKEDLK